MAYGRLRHKALALAIAVATWAACSQSADARILLDISHVGLPAVGGTDNATFGSDVVRTGAWVPVTVDVTMEGTTPFAGTLRISQFDTDGDLCYDTWPVNLVGEGGNSRRYQLYIPANSRNGQSVFQLELLDEAGEVVEVICNGEATTQPRPAMQPREIHPDSLYILEVSEGTLGKIANLVDSEQSILYDRPIVLGHLAPRDLPSLWIGLEMVDLIVWDEADPATLTPSQTEALVDWVGQGGRLLITPSRSPGSLAMSPPINGILPVDLGESIQTEDLGTLRRRMLRAPSDDPYESPVNAVRCSVRGDAQSIVWEEAAGDVLAVRREGRGFVTFCAVGLRDLFSETGSPSMFFRKVLSLKTIDNVGGDVQHISLFRHITPAISFATSGSLYLVIAVLFSICYVAISTLGLWGVLQHKKILHHTWALFSVMVIATSLLSVVAVRAVLGIESRLHQISIVDLTAGSNTAQATTFFGLKTPTDTTLDVWLPSDTMITKEPEASTCFLRPMPAGLGEVPLDFVDPQEYQLVPGSAEIRGVRIRATAKTFEGRWEGPVDGTLTGKISTVRGGSERLNIQVAKGSWVSNNLGVELKSCYLLHSLDDLLASDGHFIPENRSDQIYAYAIGDIAADGTKIDLHKRCYGQSPDPETLFESVISNRTLDKIQDGKWRRPFINMLASYGFGGSDQNQVTAGQEQDALMLLSTMGEFDHVRTLSDNAYMTPKTFSRDRFRQLDLRESMRRDSVYLIGFANDPGPVRLATRRSGTNTYRTIAPESSVSWTMYRIRIPVESAASISRRSSEKDDD